MPQTLLHSSRYAGFLIDAPPGQNRGLYRFGAGLDPVTAAAGSWGPWQDIPDWFPWENADGGVACADVTGNGRPDLIVLMVDSPQGQNAGYYRVGRDLSDQGVVTGGWTPWIPIPDWFSWENQGGRDRRRRPRRIRGPRPRHLHDRRRRRAEPRAL